MAMGFKYGRKTPSWVTINWAPNWVTSCSATSLTRGSGSRARNMAREL